MQLNWRMQQGAFISLENAAQKLPLIIRVYQF